MHAPANGMTSARSAAPFWRDCSRTSVHVTGKMSLEPLSNGQDLMSRIRIIHTHVNRHHRNLKSDPK